MVECRHSHTHSLYATYLRNRIVGALRASPDGGVQQASFAISQNFIFEHPTLDELAHALSGLVSGLTQT
ncbi:hypothetical protein PsYK624_153600 [Phanerochaete sordida]|uniref:Uncharacterized protein n=1 Tax=Phanerochaete sordida TaxID=48140 RepID=A0A9P3LLW4_9APHY|nr:hypothetical protein PsYK624_153600 [Phanerochaete sordida]